jgi:peptidoglycan LD-endopeptidase LytH
VIHSRRTWRGVRSATTGLIPFLTCMALLVLASCSGSGSATTADSSTGRDATTTSVSTTETTAPTTDSTAVDNPATPLSTLATVAPPTAAPAIYVFPLDPPTSGDYGATHHDYPATDIFTPIGTHFVAVTSGVVDYVSRTDTWDPKVDDPASRGGLSVAIVGDDGVRYYGSHLSQVADGIEPGQRVDAGQLLGLTGKSGNAATTDPHLHFGISHPTFAEDWAVRRGEVSPYPYLNAWRNGQMLKPDV